MLTMRLGAVLLAVCVALIAAPRSGSDVRDDTAWLQARLDAGQPIYLPKLPDGQCYATRGLWVSRDDTQIASNGACIRGLGPGEVRMRSTDGDPIAAEAVFYVSRINVLDPAPARISISGLRIEVPDGVELYGISILGHLVDVQNVEVTARRSTRSTSAGARTTASPRASPSPTRASPQADGTSSRSSARSTCASSAT